MTQVRSDSLPVSRTTPRSSPASGVDAINFIATILAVISLVAAYGFVRFQRETGLAPSGALPFAPAWVGAGQFLAIPGFLLAFAIQMVYHSERRRFIREHLVEVFLSAIAVGGLILTIYERIFPAAQGLPYLRWLLLGYLATQCLIQIAKWGIKLVAALPPIRSFILVFLGIILFGALLLSLPAAGYADRFPDFGNNFSDHLVTAAGAVCLTSLTVRDIATDYTPFGQAVILVLIQTGGLAVMLFGVYFVSLLSLPGNGSDLPLMKDLYHSNRWMTFTAMAKFTVFFTLLAEGLGTVLLYPMWSVSTGSEKIFKSLFHAVSAFGNAGFTLQSDSFVSYAHCWQVYGIVAGLVFLGGLGVPVLYNLFRLGRAPLSIHSKIALSASSLLILAGGLIVFALERPANANRWGRSLMYEDVAIQTDPAALRNHTGFQRLLDAGFLGICAPSAGFSTVDTTTGKLQPATMFVLTGLMVVGGSPGSTAGGIKNVTFAILIACVIAAFRRRTKTQLFGCTIGDDLVRRAFLFLFIYLAFVWTITAVLAWTHPHIGFLDLLFESASACGTSGLSVGVTSHLNLVGRFLIILAMLAGRLGPTILLLLLAAPARTKASENPILI